MKEMSLNKMILYLSCVLLNGCLDYGPDKRNIKIINKTNTEIYCLRSENDSLMNPYINYYKMGMDNLYLIKPDSFINIPDKPQSWDTFIMNCKNQKMRLFIISKDSVLKYGWEEVIKQNIYTKLYKIDLTYLENNEWKIKINGK